MISETPGSGRGGAAADHSLCFLVQARCETWGYRGGGHLHYRRKPEALGERELGSSP